MHNHAEPSELIQPLQTPLSQITLNQTTFNQMKLALAHVEDAIAWVNPQGRIEWCNAAFDRLTHCAHRALPHPLLEEVLALTIPGSTPLSIGAILSSPAEQAESCYEVCLGDRPLCLKVIRAEGGASATGTADSAMLMIQPRTGSALDDRQSEQLEESLSRVPLQPEARLKTTLEYTNVGSWMWDIATNNVVWDDNAQRLLGIVPKHYQASYESWRNCIHPDDLEGIEQAIAHSLKNASEIDIEYRVVHPDGSLHWLSGKGYGVRNEADELVQVMGLIIDITDRKQAELALAESEAKLQQQQEFLRAVIDTDPNLIFIKDKEERYVLANQAIASFHNVTVEEILAKKLEDFNLPTERVNLFAEQNHWVIHNQQGLFIAEEAVEPEHDGFTWLQWQKQPIWLPERNEYGVLGIGVNISDRKRTEAALETILQGTASAIGEDFFPVLVQSLVEALRVCYVGVSELSSSQTFSPLACWSIESFQPKSSYDFAEIPPCAQALEHGVYVCPSQIREIYPNIAVLEQLQAESYVGVAMHDQKGAAIGVLCIMHTQPIADLARAEALLRIFAIRAAAELERKRSATALRQINQELEARVAQRTQELVQFQKDLQKQTHLLQAILDNIGDGLVVTDLEGQFLVFNPAAHRILGIGAEVVSYDKWAEHYGVYLDDRLTLCPVDNLPLMRAIRGEAADNVEIFICNSQRPQGIWLDITIRPFHDPSGQIVGGVMAFRDITSKKEIDEALRQREQEFRTLVENSPDLIIRFDRQNRYCYVNPKLEKETGISAAELIGKTPSEAGFPAPLTTKWTEVIQRTFATAAEQTLDYELDLPRGRKVASARCIPELDDEGAVQSVLVVASDITDLKQTEALLRESEAQLRAIFESAPIAIGLADVVTHRHIQRNAAHRALFGYDDDEMSDLTIENITHPDDFAADLLQINQLLAGEVSQFQRQKRYIRKNGELLWGNLTCTLIRSASNRPLFIMGMIENITDRQQAEHKLLIVQEQLFIAQERLHHLLSSSPGIIYTATPSGALDGDLTLTFISTNVMQILGYELWECLDTDFWINGIHPDDVPLFITAEQEMLRQGQATCEYRFRHKNGSYRWLYDQTKLVQDEGGYPLERIGSWMDISDRKAAEAQLRQTNERLAITNVELARATRLKDEFLANMSHELRTPLNSILGLSEVMQEGAFGTLTDKQRQFLSIIQSSGKHLLELINDVLDLAKIEAGMLDLHIAETSIHSLCEASLTLIRQQANQKNISLTCTLSDNLGTLQVDERRMRQALLNLLSNAIKFTPEGGSVVLAVQENPSQSSLSFSIIDTGIGIAPEDMGKLFQTFVQLDSSLSRHYEGTGLGLVLVKQIVEMHGGQVTVSSETGQGSCFKVTLPWKTPNNRELLQDGSVLESLPKLEPSPLAQPRLLLADNDLDSVATLTDYLQTRGFEIILAQEGADMVQRAIAQHPHLVLVNVQMPKVQESNSPERDIQERDIQEREIQAVELDGLEAIRQIRARLAQIPIIALTDGAPSEEQQKSLLVSANDYLIKPVRLKQLADLIQQQIEPLKTQQKPIE
ncbi:MAG: PAS domain S-box protein [Oscillatoriophycideae cyanobacterium NC_groundwater_1537_Pr4_S-0.65um_50_18]|nr:PAS domain S-box protein [Oscillatoriophycideae cyanobacterium NC_groundwater_1537_Pr4_S-0.65um_50_18]